MRFPLSVFLLASCAAVPVAAQVATPARAPAAQAAEPFVKSVAEAAVADLAKKLEDNFVFPDKGEAYAMMLRSNLAAGKYASFADKEAFARAVTDDLQAVHKDGHVRVQVVPPEFRAGPNGGNRADAGPARGNVITNAVSKSGWIADGVAYIRFEGFPGNDDTIAAVRAFLGKHAGAKTMIIDARTHRGGGLSEMDLLFEQLYAEPVVLVDMDTRVAVERRRGSPIAGHSRAADASTVTDVAAIKT